MFIDQPVSFLSRLLVLVSFLLIASSITTAQGLLDTTFGSGGKVVTPITPGHDFVRRVRIQPDGKILTFGGTMSLNDGPAFVVRHNADGTMDTSFGDNGKVTIASDVIGLSDFDIAPNGDLIFTGSKDNGIGDSATAIYRLNNSGTGGIDELPGYDWCPGRKILAQPDGKFVVVAVCNTPQTTQHNLSIIRYLADGIFDPEFGTLGYTHLDLPVFGHADAYGDLGAVMDFVGDVLLQPDGKIVLSTFSVNDVVLVRINPNGTLDTTFGHDGYASTNSQFFGFAHPTGLVRQPDGKILVSGVEADFGLYGSFIFRFNADGTIDQSFGTNGRVSIFEPNPDSRGIGSALALQRNGKIIIAGSWNGSFGFARFQRNGAVDSAFGTNGFLTTNMSSLPVSDTALSTAWTSNGKLIAAGSVLDQDGLFDVGLARYTVQSTPFDYDGDGRSDISVWRPSNGTWYISQSVAGYRAMTWGVATDNPTPADYDGDGKTDISVWRPENGTWYFFLSATNTFTTRTWGVSGDIPAPGDFDGDGRSDLNIFRPSTGFWYRINSSNGHWVIVPYGQAGDRPVIADYDGDGRADLAVFRPSNSRWYIQRTTAGYTVRTLGSATSPLVPADYDGDGRTDIAIFSPTTNFWYVLDWETNGLSIGGWGEDGDIPAPADFDGDGKADLAVFRPSTGTWHIAFANSTAQYHFGLNGDIPTQRLRDY